MIIKKSLLISLLLFTIIHSGALAQFDAYRKRFISAQDVETLNFHMNPDSSFFLFAKERYSSSTPSGIQVIKFDKAQNMLWNKKIGDTLDNGFSNSFGTNDGHIIITGNNSNSNLYSKQYTLKMDTAGNIVKYFNNSNPMVGGGQDTDGNYVFHYDQNTVNGGVLVKTDTAGILIWQRQFQLQYSFTSIKKVIPVVNGYDVFGLHLMNSINGTRHPYMAKFDYSGNFVWAKSYVDSSIKSLNVVLKFPNGGYLLIGSDNAVNNSNNATLLIRIDDNGNMLWSKAVNHPNFETVTSGSLSASGKVLLCGYMGSATGSVLRRYFVTQVDTNGNVEWSNHYFTSLVLKFPNVFAIENGALFTNRDGASFNTNFLKINTVGESGCNDTMVAYTQYAHPLSMFTPVYTQGTAPGNSIQFNPYTVDSNSFTVNILCQTSTGLPEPGYEIYGLYPVPARSGQLVYFKTALRESCVVTLWDIYGKKVDEIPLNKNDDSFILPQLPTAMYIVTLSGVGFSEQYKICIQ